MLKDLFGFGKKRLERFEGRFRELAKDACDMDWVGSHYVTLTDYARYLQEESGIQVDTAITDRCQRSGDKSNPDYKRVRIDRLVAELAENGFADAADYVLGAFAGR